jgi:cysteinyl-tRNA synthetase
VHLYSTLTNRVEELVPGRGQSFTFYSCGPTIYDYAHVGNFRSFLNADLLRRALQLEGYTVRQVMNLTDVGHMTEDDQADGGGEDKMAVAAKRLLAAKKAGQLPPGMDVDASDQYAGSRFYGDAFLQDARRLGLLVARDEPALMPRPTAYIPQMVRMVETLLTRGLAYVARDGVVYFDAKAFGDYGALSGNTLDRIRSGEGGRVDGATQALKRHPADFMLWKPDPQHIMRWPSPWGEGYPGWHLECSAMALDLLDAGTGTIDIHSGGEDNIFPHHECEIAQARGASGAAHFARYWFHTRHLIVEGEKMSKSRGNFYTVRDILARGVSPAALRLELIRTHYRSHTNFTFQGLRDAQRQIERWLRLQRWLDTNQGGARSDAPLARALESFQRALAADLNVSSAVAALNDGVSAYDVEHAPSGTGPVSLQGELTALRRMADTLGVLDLEHEASLQGSRLDVGRIEALIVARNAARAARDWAQADALRAELTRLGAEVRDVGNETQWEPIVSG